MHEPLTVGQLRDELAKFDDDLEVFVPEMNMSGHTNATGVQKSEFLYGVEIVGW